MKNMNIHQHKLSCIIALTLACLLVNISLYAQTQTSVFAHYNGVNGLAYINGMQQVHEYEYTYYVTKGEKIELPLPFEGYSSEGRKRDEPKGYIRWYDYKTDMKATNLSIYISTDSLVKTKSLLKTVCDADGKDRGLFSWKDKTNSEPEGPNRYTIGVNYTAPAEADNKDWAGEDIACDVSRYTDFDAVTVTSKDGTATTDQVFTHEPTLQIRYIFHIRPAKQMAENIIKTTSADLRGKYSDITIEDNKRIVFGAKDENSKMALKVNYKTSNYFFYPLKTSTHHIYADDTTKLIKSTDFDTTRLLKATNYQWRVYDETKTKYGRLYTNADDAFQMISATDLTTIREHVVGWTDIKNNTSCSKPDFDFGSVVYYVVYAKNGDDMAPIANFEVLYQNSYPKTQEQINEDGDTERNIDYFENHYTPATKPISFDQDNNTLTYEAPRSDNVWSQYASRWDRRAYGYAYQQLYKYACPKDYLLTHGEYGIFKSININAVIHQGAAGDSILNDRTCALTGGKQYGYFIYFDASDESRQIAAIDFKSDLCSGAKLIFSAAVADATSNDAPTRPQVLFKLYGVIKDENDKVTYKRLLTSFSSGDFNTNTKGERMFGKWYQVYSRILIRKKTGVENFSDFRIEVVNMCNGTSGADYAIDDIRLYIQHAKMDVMQNEPVCPDFKSTTAPNNITLKIATHYDNVQAMIGERKASKLFYRICDLSGNPLTYIDYDDDGSADEYGTAEVPANYDKDKMLPSYAAGGSSTTPMFYLDPEKHIMLTLANRHFGLPLGQKFYVSVAYPDDDNPLLPGTWGKPADACSTYSSDFEIVRENLVISDANGNVVTTIRVSCDANRTPDVKINAKLETADNIGGGSITLTKVKFDWFLSELNKDNDFATITNLQQALRQYRDKYPEATGLDAGYEAVNSTYYNILKTYVDAKRLVLSANNNLDNYKFEKNMIGTYKIAAIPIATQIQEGSSSITYHICPDPMYFTLRVVENGPKLTLGFKDVVYPNDERAVRIGLPQIKAMLNKTQYLNLPVTSLESSTPIVFEHESEVFISETNDPTFDINNQIIGTIHNPTLNTTDGVLGIQFNKSALTTFHEGYWYELNFSYKQQQGIGTTATITCPGEMFITFKIVPEYLTWNSTLNNRLNANWNNDLNWMRSTAQEIYDAQYTDYGTASTYKGNPFDNKLTRQMSYSPMKFSKVTIPDQTGKVYPTLGNIVYREGNNIATKLNNAKGDEPTTNIRYDMTVKWNYYTSDHSDNGNGVFSCETFKGNLCDEIYFKPQAELINQNYLVYQKAYAETEVEKNKWNILSSPLKSTYSGNFYAPKTDGRQETKAFEPITFSTTYNSRTVAPVYQRNWDSNGKEVAEVVDGITRYYNAYDYDGSFRIDTITDRSMNVESLYWSHVYNKVGEKYDNGNGFALKSGDDYSTTLANKSLFRLPKQDVSYDYYKADGSANESLREVIDTTGIYKLLVSYDAAEDALSRIMQPLDNNTHNTNRYYIVGNPYTATISMYNFLKGNPCFERKVWTMVNGELAAYSIPEGDYNRRQDVLIAPMQAFFVKLKKGETATSAYFTSPMTIDRWIVGGKSGAANIPEISINAIADKRQCATAKVVLREDASADFINEEDIELLNNTDINDMPQIYTIAGDQAAALNTLPNINFLPFGVIAKQDGWVERNGVKIAVELTPNRNLKTPLYVLDAKTGTFSLADHPIEIVANEHGRYYITTSKYTTNVEKTEVNLVRCFSAQDGTITVCSPNKALSSVKVYTIDGMLIASELDINAASWQKHVARGVYVVKTETAHHKTATFKLTVK